MAALSMRQVLAEQLASYIRRRGGWAMNPLPLKDSDHLRLEVRLSDDTLSSDLERLGFKLRLCLELASRFPNKSGKSGALCKRANRIPLSPPVFLNQSVGFPHY